MEALLPFDEHITECITITKKGKRPQWRTAAGEKMFVDNMKTNHILNILKCYDGKGKTEIPDDYLGGREKWIKIFNDELLKRRKL